MSNKYKIHQTQIGNNTIQIIVATTTDGKILHIPIDEGNIDYQQFVKDIHANGLEIVEGADVETQISYVDARVAEYPPLQEQLDTIYHHGIPAWHTQIREIKNKYPKTQVGVTTISDLPSWVIQLST